MSDIESSVESANLVSNRLSVSYYSMTAWIVLVTIALVAVAAVSIYRKYPGRRRSNLVDDDSIVSVTTDSDLPTFDDIDSLTDVDCCNKLSAPQRPSSSVSEIGDGNEFNFV